MTMGEKSFNPCFNGTYSLTKFLNSVVTVGKNVLILVLMELIL